MFKTFKGSKVKIFIEGFGNHYWCERYLIYRVADTDNKITAILSHPEITFICVITIVVRLFKFK